MLPQKFQQKLPQKLPQMFQQKPLCQRQPLIKCVPSSRSVFASNPFIKKRAMVLILNGTTSCTEGWPGLGPSCCLWSSTIWSVS